MAVIIDIIAEQSDNGKKITINDLSDWDDNGGESGDSLSTIVQIDISVRKWDYENDVYIDYGQRSISESGYDSISDLEYYIESNGNNLTIQSKTEESNSDLAVALSGGQTYSNEIIKDGIWEIGIQYHLTTVGNTRPASEFALFLFHYNYESKLSIYNVFRDLADHYKKDEISYDSKLESALLKKAFLNSLNYAASFGQFEIIEEVDLFLQDLLKEND